MSLRIVRGHRPSNPLRDGNLDGRMQENFLDSKDVLTSLIAGNWSTASGQRTEICTGLPEKVTVGKKCSRLVSKWYLNSQTERNCWRMLQSVLLVPGSDRNVIVEDQDRGKMVPEMSDIDSNFVPSTVGQSKCIGIGLPRWIDSSSIAVIAKGVVVLTWNSHRCQTNPRGRALFTLPACLLMVNGAIPTEMIALESRISLLSPCQSVNRWSYRISAHRQKSMDFSASVADLIGW